MRKLAVIAVAALISLASPALASPALAEELTMETVLGTTIEEVQASLVEKGYEVRKAEMEDGKIEVYFVRDGQMGEVYVDPQTGTITKLDLK
ncbi:MAG: PepSY domain-containing protein [Parvibaculum sp.]